MKNFRLTRKLMMGAAFACAISLTFTSCDDDDDGPVEPPVTNIDENGYETFTNAQGIVSAKVISNVTSDVTWRKDQEYILSGRIQVADGATLTIQPGTVIKGEAGTGANATALIVARGGKLMAEGTAAEPIIFTTVADRIQSGEVESPNLDNDANGFWGGLIVLGKAPITASTSEAAIEGVPTSENAIYGGSDAADNSGVIKYVSIRHGGSNIGAGNEINGLTLGGVGSGTVIDHVEIVANADDGIEWFGGTVNVSNLLVWNSFDDAVDTDQEWTGTLNNFVVVTPRGHCFELDGPEPGATMADKNFTLTNGTVVASDTTNEVVSEDLINVDANTNATLSNIHITGIAINAGDYSAQRINRVTAEDVTFTNITLNVDAATLGDHVNGAVPSGVTTSTTAAATNKANAGVFSWTWAAKAGGTAGL